MLRLARPIVAVITRMVPRQSNLFGFVIEKPRIPADLQSWMRVEDGELLPDRKVVERRYGSPS